jgi:membrane-associated protein
VVDRPIQDPVGRRIRAPAELGPGSERSDPGGLASVEDHDVMSLREGPSVTGLVDHLLTLPAWTVLVVTGALVFVEDALFVGFVLPAETAAILAGVAANRGNVNVVAVLAVVIVAAILGDSVGYEVGRHFGPRVLGWHRLESHRSRLDAAQDLLARRGGTAVLLGRFVAFFRAVMPALAGTSLMHYRTFRAFNAAGGVIWGAGVVLLGYFAGESYTRVEGLLGKGTAVAVVVLVVGALIAWRIHKFRTERALRQD